MASPRTRPSSELVDDTITDVLLRLPPEDPTHLVRASLVCKQWRRVLSHPDFLRLYARVHPTPPLLGFFFTLSSSSSEPIIPTRFVPTFSASVAAAAAGGRRALAIDHDHCPWQVLDCRHGRVLLQRRRRHVADDDDARAFLFWDPVTGDRHDLPLPWPDTASRRRSAVVLCAAAGDGCDHSTCRGGAFLVLCADVGIHRPTGRWRARARVYSSQLHAWGAAPVHLDLRGFEHFHHSRAAVVGDQVYLFRLFLGDKIVRYDLHRRCLSAIDSPGFFRDDIDVELMVTEDGMLGLAGARRCSVHVWSRTADDAGWEQSRVIDLRTMISVSPPAGAGNDDNRSSIIEGANVIGFAEGVNAMLVGTNAGTFVIDLKSERARKICDTWIQNPVVPFMTFYSPDWACGKSPLPPETD